MRQASQYNLAVSKYVKKHTFSRGFAPVLSSFQNRPGIISQKQPLISERLRMNSSHASAQPPDSDEYDPSLFERSIHNMPPLDFSYTKKPRTVLIVKKWQSKSASLSATRIAQWFTDHGIQVFIEPTTVGDYEIDYPSTFDLMHATDPSFDTIFDTSFSHNAGKIFDTPNMLSEDGSRVTLLSDTPDVANPWESFARTKAAESVLSRLDPRECIAFSRKYSRWEQALDMCVSIGGDGTLLHVSSLFKHRVPPTLAFGSGSFGFLMPFNPERYTSVLQRLLDGELRVFNRARLAFKVGGITDYAPNGAPIVPPFSHDDNSCFHLLNEVVLKHSYGLNVGSGISEIECRINGELLGHFQGDGVMVASATGSTAYSMAAGGSIVHPASSSLLLSPICPLTLSSRPLVLPPQCTITLRPVHDSVLLEGKYGRVLHPGEAVTIRQSHFPIPVFIRSDVTTDFVNDLVNRLNYARVVRVRRKGDQLDSLDLQTDGPDGAYVSKRNSGQNN